MSALYDFLFGCWHLNLSWPRSQKHSLTGAYVVCLDCGQEFNYDWDGMKVLDRRAA